MSSLSEVERYLLAARLKGYMLSNSDAVAILSEGLRAHPGDIRLLQLRGVKRLIERDAHGALDDLASAARCLGDLPDVHEFYRSVVEEDVIKIVLGRDELVGEQYPQVDGQFVPEARNLARGTFRASTWHHLGIAHYLLRDFSSAATVFAQARVAAIEEHQRIAALDWEYMSLRRLGDSGTALKLLESTGDFPVCTTDVDPPSVLSSLTGWYKQRLQLYRGELQPQDLLKSDSSQALAISTLGYGVGNWYLYNGFEDAAYRTFSRVLEYGDSTAFGHVAAGFETR